MTELLEGKLERAEKYKVLAECFFLPNDELYELLTGFENKYPDGEFSELVNSFNEAEGLQSLEVDFSKLFVGPFKMLASPYGSVHLGESRLMGDSTLDVKSLYRAEGLDMTLREAPDHVGVELEFMYYLAMTEIEALENSNQQKAAGYREKQLDFMKVHLGQWVSALAEIVEANAGTGFYRALGRLVRGFIEKDIEELFFQTSADEI